MNARQIDRFFRFLAEELAAPGKAIVTGAAGGALLGRVRPSLDIDFQFRTLRRADWRKVDAAVTRAARRAGIAANYAEDIDRWGMVTLLDFERHARFYKRFGTLRVLVMDPVYWAIGKLTRYLEPDRLDLAAVFRRRKPPIERAIAVWGRALRRSPRSPQLRLFLDHARHFLHAHGRSVWGPSFDAADAADRLAATARIKPS